MKFDEEFLTEVGLQEMPENQKEVFLKYVEEEVQVRVGEKIAEGVSEEKLAEFEEIDDSLEARKWLLRYKPDFEKIIDGVVDEIKKEIVANREMILR